MLVTEMSCCDVNMHYSNELACRLAVRGSPVTIAYVATADSILSAGTPLPLACSCTLKAMPSAWFTSGTIMQFCRHRANVSRAHLLQQKFRRSRFTKYVWNQQRLSYSCFVGPPCAAHLAQLETRWYFKCQSDICQRYRSSVSQIDLDREHFGWAA